MAQNSAVEVYIPKYGQTVEEVKIVQWLVEDGATVKKGQEILEIETDKTTFFVESEAAGMVHRGPYQVGDTVPVLEVVAVIGKPEDKFVAHKVGEEPEPVLDASRGEVSSPSVAGAEGAAQGGAWRRAGAAQVAAAAQGGETPPLQRSSPPHARASWRRRGGSTSRR